MKSILTFFLLCSFVVLTGCTTRGPSSKVGVYQCTFRNHTTLEKFTAVDSRRIQAIKKARHDCRLGPVPWNCMFRACEEVGKS